MPIVSQGNSVVVDVGAHDGLWIKSTGSAEVTVNQVYAGTPEVINVTTETVRVGFYGEPVTVSIRAVSGNVDYQDTPDKVYPLTSVQGGQRSDSSPLDIAQTVNGLVAKAGGVGVSTQYIPSIKSLPTVQIDGSAFNVGGYYAGATVGGGDFIYDASRSKTGHNGGTVIAPEAIAAWDGTSANLSQILNWTGTGSGCYVRIGEFDGCVYCFGALLNNVADDTLAIQKAIDNGGAYIPYTTTGFAATTLQLKLNSFLLGEPVSSTFPDVETATTFNQIAGTTDYAIKDDNAAAGFSGRKGGWTLSDIYVKAAASSDGAIYTNNTHRWNIPRARFRGGKRAARFIDTFDVNLGVVRFADSKQTFTCLSIEASGSNDNSNNFVMDDITIEGFEGRALSIAGTDGAANRVNKLYFNKLKIETVKNTFTANEYIYMAGCDDINLGRVDLSTTSLTSLTSSFQYLTFGSTVSGVYGQIVINSNGNSTVIDAPLGVKGDLSGSTSNIQIEIGLAVSDVAHMGGNLVKVRDRTITNWKLNIIRQDATTSNALDDGTLQPIVVTSGGAVANNSCSLIDARGIVFGPSSNSRPRIRSDLTLERRSAEVMIELRRNNADGSNLATWQHGRIASNGAFKLVSFVQGVTGEQPSYLCRPPLASPNGNHRNFCVGDGANTTGGWNTGHLEIGQYHLWVDSTGDLRIKSSAPTSDTDGTVVGTQT